ncbi:MAG TPA: hypothetical protein VFD57_05560, partial [Clostridia bacterium]|nr:hypothetical protein [Clostridia bacterium]
MKKSLTKFLAILTVIFLLTSVLAACAGDKKEEEVPSSTDDTQEEAPEPEEEPEEEPEAEPEDEPSAETGQTPRSETLYFAGQQWGAVNDFNPLSSNSNNGMMIEQNDDARTLVWETLFMYNQLDGRLYGLLAKEYKQEDKV